MSYTAVEQPGRERREMVDSKMTGSRTFHVISATRMTGWETITGLPARGDDWPGYDGLVAQEISATETEQLTGGWIWIFKVEYRNWIEDDESSSNTMAEVLSRAAVWSWDSEPVEETRFEDLDGVPYINTAGDPFNPPPTFSIAHPIATVRKNRSSLDGGFILAYVNTVNHATFAGASRGYVRMNRISGEPKQLGTTTYYETTFVLEYNPRGWVPHYELNQGPRARPAKDQTPEFPTDENGVVSTEPVLLDADGLKLTPLKIFSGPPAVWVPSPTYSQFRQYDYQNFSVLGLT